MSQGWENLDPSPLEYFHAQILEAFHEFRLKGVGVSEYDTKVIMDGIDLDKIIAQAKLNTYAKYPHQISDKPIPKG